MPSQLVPNCTHGARLFNMKPTFVWIRVTAELKAANDDKK